MIDKVNEEDSQEGKRLNQDLIERLKSIYLVASFHNYIIQNRPDYLIKTIYHNMKNALANMNIIRQVLDKPIKVKYGTNNELTDEASIFITKSESKIIDEILNYPPICMTIQPFDSDLFLVELYILNIGNAFCKITMHENNFIHPDVMSGEFYKSGQFYCTHFSMQLSSIDQYRQETEELIKVFDDELYKAMIRLLRFCIGIGVTKN